MTFKKNIQYYKFSAYGFFKNLRFFDAFLILFLVEKGMSYTQIGTLYAVREIFTFFFEIPSGIIADSFGRKNALVGSFLIFILSFLIFYFSTYFLLFMLGFILFGIADAFRSGTHKGMIMDYLKIQSWEDQKINYYGHTRSWSQKGSALSALMAGLIVFYAGSYQSIFLYSVIPALLNTIMLLTYPKQLNFSGKKKPVSGIQGTADTVKSFLNVIRQKKVFQVVSESALHTAYLKAIKDYIQPLLVYVAAIIPVLMQVKEEQKSGVIIGVIYFIIYFLTSLASKQAGIVDTRKHSRISPVTLLFGFGAGIICGVFFMYQLWIISLVFFIAIYLIENFRKPVLTGLISNQTPNNILTSVISAQSFLRTIITAVLAFLFGVIADYTDIGMALISISLLLTVVYVIISVTSAQRANGIKFG